MRARRRRWCREATTLLSAVALVPLLLGPAPAQAGSVVPAIPSVDPADQVPEVFDDAEVTQAGVRVVRRVGGTMYAGGDFRLVRDLSRGKTLRRSNLMAFAPGTGKVKGWKPRATGLDGQIDEGSVYALESTPNNRFLYVAGDFDRFDGRKVNSLVRVNLRTKEATRRFAFPVSVARVSDLALVGERLVVSGTFPGGIVAVDPKTGALDPYFDATQVTGQQERYTHRVYRFALSPDGTRMVILGSFTAVGGQPREQAAMLTLGPDAAAVSEWTSDAWQASCSRRVQWYTRDVDWSPDGTHFAIVTSGGDHYPDLCDTVSWWAAEDAPADPVWVNYSGGDTFHSVAVTDKGVFVGGHFRWLDNPLGDNHPGPGAVVAQGVGAIDPVTGLALDWDPHKSVEGGRGAFALVFTDRGLWIGHFEERVHGESHRGLALLPF